MKKEKKRKVPFSWEIAEEEEEDDEEASVKEEAATNKDRKEGILASTHTSISVTVILSLCVSWVK